MTENLYLVVFSVVPMCIGIQMAKKLNKRKPGVFFITLIVVSFVYLSGVVYFTAIQGPRRGLSGYRLRIMLPILWVFRGRGYLSAAIVHLLNILLLVPFGYLLPHFKKVPWWKVVLLGFCFSLLIESCQYIFHFGFFQTDDLIDNTIGAGVGYLLFLVLNLSDFKNDQDNK